MVMPFIRLLAIYAAVIVGLTAFFQRDKIMDLAGFNSEETSQEEMPETAVNTPDPETTAAKPATQNAAEPVNKTDASESSGDVADSSTSEQPMTEPTLLVTTEPNPIARPTTLTSATRQLNNARKAYWQGDMAGAERIYRELLTGTPENADANGELGNVLYAQRRYSDAAEFYFAAGKILISNGNSDQALPLFQILQGIAPEHAASLHALATK